MGLHIRQFDEITPSLEIGGQSVVKLADHRFEWWGTLSFQLWMLLDFTMILKQIASAKI
jgi:hypothetical protein